MLLTVEIQERKNQGKNIPEYMYVAQPQLQKKTARNGRVQTLFS